MKKIFWAALIVLLTATTACARKERPILPNERPLYGGAVPAADLAKDSKRNDALIRRTGSREAALQKTLEEALASYQRGYFELAMHRYNQAWLLSPDDPEVFNGFALVLSAQGKFNEAIGVYKKYLERVPNHPMTLCRLARQHQNQAVAGLIHPVLGQDASREASGHMAEALRLYEEASRQAKQERDLSYIYYQWAIGLAVKKDYRDALEKVRLSQRHGGEFIEKGFLEALSREIPKLPEEGARA